ncbi:MAG: hypothetical protein U1F43_22730 [Myxococcota bacterium]
MRMTRRTTWMLAAAVAAVAGIAIGVWATSSSKRRHHPRGASELVVTPERDSAEEVVLRFLVAARTAEVEAGFSAAEALMTLPADSYEARSGRRSAFEVMHRRIGELLVDDEHQRPTYRIDHRDEPAEGMLDLYVAMGRGVLPARFSLVRAAPPDGRWRVVSAQTP